MRGKLVMLLVCMGILWGIKEPVGAAVFYVWVTLFRPLDFAFAPLPSLAPIAFALLVVSIGIASARGIVKLKWNIACSYLLAIICVAFLSACLAPIQGRAWEKFTEVWKIILPSILISMIISTEREHRAVIITFAGSIGIWAIQAAIHGATSGGAAESMSIGGQMSDRNDFAVGVLMTWPIFYYLGLNEKRKLIKKGIQGATFLTCLCVIVSNSRGAMLGLFATLFMNITRKGTKRIKNLVTTVVLLPLMIPLIPQYAIDRLNTINFSGGEQKEASANARTVLMKSGLTGSLDRPFFGFGPGCWPIHAHKYIPGGAMGDGAVEPHCVWIKISTELGFVGLGVYLLMFWRITANLKKIQKKCLRIGRRDYYNYAYMLQLSIIGFCLGASLINQSFYEYMFLVIAVSGAFIRSWKVYMESAEEADK